MSDSSVGRAEIAAETARGIFVRLMWTVYVPFVFAGLGRGMLIPVLPLYLRDEGLSYGQVAVVLAAIGVGAVAAGVPIGTIAGRVGPYRLFVVSTVVVALAAAFTGLTTAVIALVGFRFAFGAGNVGLRVGMQTIVRAETEARSRGRAMAIVGGMRRLSVFIGPVIGGVLAEFAGYRWTFIAAGAISVVGLVPFLVAWPAEASSRPPEGASKVMRQVVSRYRWLLLLAGSGQALVLTVREGREVVVPLIGDDIGLSPGIVGLLVAVGTGADLLLFPIAGWLSDRFGRLHAIVPSFSMLGAGLLVLSAWPTTVGMVVAVTIMGIGNGLSAGTMLTMGADLAPEDSGPFLAALGTIGDIGLVVAPLLVGWLAGAAGLATSAFTLGMLMFVGVAWIVVALGDTSRPKRPWLRRQLGADVEFS